MQKYELETINPCTIVIQYLHDVFFFFFTLLPLFLPLLGGLLLRLYPFNTSIPSL
ncbi:hypothetical protein BDZ91DRAFT_743806, partial [Kalaharituber pfeilii]